MQVLKPAQVAPVSTKAQKISRKIIISKIFSFTLIQKFISILSLNFCREWCPMTPYLTASHLNFSINYVNSVQFQM